MKEPKVTSKDRAKFPKVQDAYENAFKKSYQEMIKASLTELMDKLGKAIKGV